jgi:phosphoribosylaminoimidazolecarboxamide formyltransferase/IMP cyclohydrolase
LDEIGSQGTTTLATRFRLARKVFDLTSRYDTAISTWLNRIDPATVG